jgi:hypothetical protein
LRPGIGVFDEWGRPIPPGTSLRGLGIALQWLLAATIALLVNGIAAELNERRVVDKLIGDGYSVTLAQAHSADLRVNTAGNLELLAYVVTGIVWIVWFSLARQNAQAYDAGIHPRSQGWAIGGWFCPVVCFWFPYQMTRDILRADQRREQPSPPSQPSSPLVRSWWALLLAALLFDRIVGFQKGTTLGELHTKVTLAIFADVIVTLAAIAALLVVRKLTGANENKRTWLLKGQFQARLQYPGGPQQYLGGPLPNPYPQA